MKKKIIIAISGIVLLLFTLNVIINKVVGSKIEEKLGEVLDKIEGAGVSNSAFTYKSVSYSWINSTVKFENVEFYIDDDQYLRSEELKFKGNLEELPLLDDLENGEFSMDFKDLKLSFINLKLKIDELNVSLDQGSFEFNGRLDAEREEVFFTKLGISFEDMSVSAEGETLKIGMLDWVMHTDDGINLVDIEDEFERIPEMDNLRFSFRMSDYSLPNELISSLEFDDFGIMELYGSDLDINLDKKGNNLYTKFSLDSEPVGTIDLDCSFDFSGNQNDPIIDLKVGFFDLNEGLVELLGDLNLNKDKENAFSFEYKGKVSGIESALN